MADKYVLVDQSELKRVVDTYKAAMGLYDATLTWQQVAQCFDEQVACIRDITSYGSTYADCIVGINVSTDRILASASFPSAISVLLGKATNLSGITASGSPKIESFSAPEATTIGSATLNGLMPQSGQGGWRNRAGMILNLPKVTNLPDEAFKKSTGRFPYTLTFPSVVSVGQHAFSKEALGISDSWAVGMYGLDLPNCTVIGNQALGSGTDYGIGMVAGSSEIDYSRGFVNFDTYARLNLPKVTVWNENLFDSYRLNVYPLGVLSEISLPSVTSMYNPSTAYHMFLRMCRIQIGTDPVTGDPVYGHPLKKLDLHSLNSLRYGYKSGRLGINYLEVGDGFFLSVSDWTDLQTSTHPHYTTTWYRLEYLDLHSVTYIKPNDLVRMPAMKYLDVSSMASLEGTGFEGSAPLETFLAGSLTAFPTWLSGCANLKEADLSGLSAIPDGAFAACPAMETLRINNPTAFPDEDSVRNAAGFPWGLPAGATVYFNTRESGDSLTVEED